MIYTKKVFDHDVITSDFLNDLQDYVIYIDNKPRQPMMIPANEYDWTVPQRAGDTVVIRGQDYLMNVDPTIVGDIIVGIPSGYLARVTQTDGQTSTITGLGKRIS